MRRWSRRTDLSRGKLSDTAVPSNGSSPQAINQFEVIETGTLVPFYGRLAP